MNKTYFFCEKFFLSHDVPRPADFVPSAAGPATLGRERKNYALFGARSKNAPFGKVPTTQYMNGASAAFPPVSLAKTGVGRSGIGRMQTAGFKQTSKKSLL